MLTALSTEYEDKPILQQKLRDKIKDKLELKVEQIQADIIEKFLIKDSDQLAHWISFYSKRSQTVAQTVALF